MKTGADQKIIINDPSEIPAFKSEAEEHEFWKTHTMGDGMFEDVDPPAEGELPPVRPRTRPVPSRFEESMLARLKVLAERRGVGYQTLLKQFVGERLYEEEKRERLIAKTGRAPRRMPRQFVMLAAARRSGIPAEFALTKRKRQSPHA
jgi:hypothetical protein